MQLRRNRYANTFCIRTTLLYLLVITDVHCRRSCRFSYFACAHSEVWFCTQHASGCQMGVFGPPKWPSRDSFTSRIAYVSACTWNTPLLGRRPNPIFGCFWMTRKHPFGGCAILGVRCTLHDIRCAHSACASVMQHHFDQCVSHSHRCSNCVPRYSGRLIGLLSWVVSIVVPMPSG